MACERSATAIIMLRIPCLQTQRRQIHRAIMDIGSRLQR